jgi:hypothetical protein
MTKFSDYIKQNEETTSGDVAQVPSRLGDKNVYKRAQQTFQTPKTHKTSKVYKRSNTWRLNQEVDIGSFRIGLYDNQSLTDKVWRVEEIVIPRMELTDSFETKDQDVAMAKYKEYRKAARDYQNSKESK